MGFLQKVHAFKVTLKNKGHWGYRYRYTVYTHIIYTYYTSPLFFFSWFLITTTLHQLFKFYLTKQKHLNLRRFWEVEAKTRGSVSTAVFRDDEPLKLGSVKEL